METHLVVLGCICSPHGVKGDLKLMSFSENPSDVFSYPNLWIGKEKEWKPCNVIQKSFMGGNKFLVQVEGVNDREKARMLTHSLLAVDRKDLPELNPGVFYWSDLEGLEAYDEQGNLVGVLMYLYACDSCDMMHIKNERGESFEIPWIINESVLFVDLKLKQIRIRFPQ